MRRAQVLGLWLAGMLACSASQGPTQEGGAGGGTAGAAAGRGGGGPAGAPGGNGGSTPSDRGGAGGGVAGRGGDPGGSAGIGGRGGDEVAGSAGIGGSATAGRGGAAGASAERGGAGGASAGRGGAAGGAGGAPSGRGGAGGTAGGAAGLSGRGGAVGGSGGTAGGFAGAGGQVDCPGARYDAAHPPTALTLTGNLGTHDPSAIVAGGRIYEFQTGARLPTKTSTDLLAWTAGPAVFSANPTWVATQVPGAGDLWAPDISFFGGTYHLYYAASTFGSNHSCIGHATRAALDSGSWTDRGTVVCSNAGSARDDWNAIDPNVVLDDAGTPWLAFGSFWGGLKMVKLDQTGARADTTLHAIAARPNAGGALEAPFVFKRCGIYYLFTSWDKCCAGVDSTYNIRVGRATSVTGPYADKAGVALMQGGGTLVTAGDARWKGPGHNAIIVSGDRTYNVHHAYDAQNNGASFLRITEVAWDSDGWPVSSAP